MPNITKRVKNAWNAFTNRSPTFANTAFVPGVHISSSRPDRIRIHSGGGRTITNSIYNKIALDVSMMDFKHCKLDENLRYEDDIHSPLYSCLSLSANLDQNARAFIQDVVVSLLDEGCVAIVPIDVDEDIDANGNQIFDIYSLRVAKILEWMPDQIRVKCYNERTCNYQELVVPKSTTAIIENPFNSVMNDANSTVSRLNKKMAMLDNIDAIQASGKLDLIIQLPYTVRTEQRRAEANERVNNIKEQLTASDLGIAYTDGTEKITQLNRPVENNLQRQVEYLTEQLYAQLNFNQSIMDGTAEESVMLNYYSRTIQPIVEAIILEMHRKFIPMSRWNKETILAFRDPFKLVPVSTMATIGDSFTRNEILASNEIRQGMGFRPSKDPRADELVNKNLSQPSGQNGGGKDIKEIKKGETDEKV